MLEIQAMAISAAIEAPIAYLVVRIARWPSRGAIHAGFASAVATAVTHPQLWAAAQWAYPRFGFWPSVAGLEALVVLAEGALIAWMAALAFHRATLISLLANSASCLAGLFIIR